MLDPNPHILGRVIHEQRIEEVLRRQRHGQPQESGWRLLRSSRIDMLSNFQEIEGQMIPDPMEFSGRDRWQTLLQAAEQHRLLKSMAAQPANQGTVVWQIRHWLGTQLVAWGCQLQGYGVASLPPLPECEPCKG